MSPTPLWTRMGNACRRRAARWLSRRPFTILPGRPIVSFTFDDFPRSAFTTAAPLLEQYGFLGTYYTALGLAGSRGPGGVHFERSDLPELLHHGHELGCHTFDHCAAWETSPSEFTRSVGHNATALEAMIPYARFRTLSYPISYPKPLTKRRMGRRFACCRGGGQTTNAGRIDANYLASFFLEQSHGGIAEIDALLRQNFLRSGWLIFSTHEVTDRPGRFGCRTSFFEQVVKHVAQSGALVLPVYAAWRHLKARSVSPA